MLRIGGLISVCLIAFGFQSVRAEGQDPPLCAFAKRVLAERPAEFAAFKGGRDPIDKHEMSFTGTVTPDETTTCTLHVRRKIGPQILQPIYVCTKFQLEPDAGKALYEQHKAELATCFDGATFDETFPKTENEPMLTWTWVATTPEYSAKLEASNGLDLLQKMFNGKPETDLKMAVSLTITDLSPTPPGAVMPEEP
jgi:hypothetical protein